MSCARCQTAQYCNVECQRKDWTLHKHRCRGGGGTPAIATFDELCARMQHLYSKAARRHESLVQTLGLDRPLDLYWSQHVEVRRSEYVHGRGLFACDTVSLPANAVLTCWPVHYLVGGHHPTKEVVDRHLLDNYSTALGQHVVVGDPERCGDKRLLGHMVNDAALVDVFASCSADDLRDAPRLRKLLVVFLENTIKYTNCVFLSDARNTVRCLVTRREVAPGEELLVSYGVRYWLEKNYGRHYDRDYPFIGDTLRRLILEDRKVQKLSARVMLQLDMPVMLAMASAGGVQL